MAVNTTFSVGQVLTAAQMNNLPWGYVGLQTLTTAYVTTATHTTFQDNGMTLTFTEVSGRVYRITARVNPYPSGGLQGIKMQIVRGSTALAQSDFSPNVLDTGVSFPTVITYVYTSTASGSATFKMQIGALTANTAVQDFGSTTYPRQFFIEDIGKS
jgi:hypothetical protein